MNTTLSSGRGRRVFQGFAAFFAGFGARTIMQFVQVPLFLHFWSPERYGEWLLLFTVPIYLALTDLGIGSAGSVALAEHVAAGNKRAARSVASALRAIIITLNLILTAAVVGLLVAGVPQAFGFHAIVGADLDIAFAALSAYVIVGLQLECGFAVLRGIGRYPDQIASTAALTVAELAAIIIALFAFGTAASVACAMLLVRALGWAWLALYVRREAPALRGIDFEGIRQQVAILIKPALGFAILPLLNAVKIQGGTIVIGILFGPAMLASFNAMRILSRLLDIAASPSNFLMTESSYEAGEERLAGIRQLHRRFMRPVVVFTAIGVVGLLVLAGPFFRLWTHDDLRFDWIALALLLIGSVWRVAAGVGLNIAAALSQHTRPAVINMIASAALMMAAYFAGAWSGDYHLVLIIFALAELVYLVTFYSQAFAASHDHTRAFVRDVFSWPAMVADLRFVQGKLRSRLR